MHPHYIEPCKIALNKLLDHFAGNKSQLAHSCGVTRNCVSYWFNRGYVGRDSAIVIDSNPTIPMSKEELRPDIKSWAAYKQPKVKQL